MSESIEKIDRPPPVSEIVLERLRSDIIQNRFALGEKISENLLSELYGVTKAPIRSAYIRLEGEGLIEIRPQAGTFVFNPDGNELRALCELRISLEREAARLAILRNQSSLAKDFTRTVKEMEEALSKGNLGHYQNLDTVLHLTIIRWANSPILAETYKTQVNSRFAALRHRFSQQRAHNENSIAEHRALRDAVIANDKDAFLLLIRTHIANTENYFSKIAS